MPPELCIFAITSPSFIQLVIVPASTSPTIPPENIPELYVLSFSNGIAFMFAKLVQFSIVPLLIPAIAPTHLQPTIFPLEIFIFFTTPVSPNAPINPISPLVSFFIFIFAIILSCPSNAPLNCLVVS